MDFSLSDKFSCIKRALARITRKKKMEDYMNPTQIAFLKGK